MGVVIYESPEGIAHLSKMLRAAWKAGREDEDSYAVYFEMLNSTVCDQTRAMRICFHLAEQSMVLKRAGMIGAGQVTEVYTSDDAVIGDAEEAANLFLNEVAYGATEDAHETFVAVAMQGDREDLAIFLNVIVSFSCAE